MVITTRTHKTLFAKKTEAPNSSKVTLIRLPLSVVPHYETRCHVTGAIIPAANKPLFRPNLWSSDEHERFLHGLEMFPNGPWKEVAKVVGTKTTRQTMTHAQKYRQKIERRMQAEKKTMPPRAHYGTVKHPSIESATAKYHAPAKAQVTRRSEIPYWTGERDWNVADRAFATASRTDICANCFDTSVAPLDLEFDSILAILKPLSKDLESSLVCL